MDEFVRPGYEGANHDELDALSHERIAYLLDSEAQTLEDLAAQKRAAAQAHRDNARSIRNQ